MSIQEIRDYYRIEKKAASGKRTADGAGPLAGREDETGRYDGSKGRKLFEGGSTALRLQIKAILQDVANGYDKSISVGDLQNSRSRLTAMVEESVRKTLKEFGVDESAEFSLGLDPVTGRLFVHSDHPEKARIEMVLLGRSDISDTFNRISTLQEISRLAKRSTPNDIRGNFIDKVPPEDLANFGRNPFYMHFSPKGTREYTGLSKRV